MPKGKRIENTISAKKSPCINTLSLICISPIYAIIEALHSRSKSKNESFVMIADINPQFEMTDATVN